MTTYIAIMLVWHSDRFRVIDYLFAGVFCISSFPFVVSRGGTGYERKAIYGKYLCILCGFFRLACVCEAGNPMTVDLIVESILWNLVLLRSDLSSLPDRSRASFRLSTRCKEYFHTPIGAFTLKCHVYHSYHCEFKIATLAQDSNTSACQSP
jgi:hypothetical protein